MSAIKRDINRAGVRLPSVGGEHNHLRGRRTPLRIHLRRQNHPCVGAGHPRASAPHPAFLMHQCLPESQDPLVGLLLASELESVMLSRDAPLDKDLKGIRSFFGCLLLPLV